MCKIACTADIHLRGKDLKAGAAQLKTMVNECKNRGVDLVLFAGDMFEQSQIGDNQSSSGAVIEVALTLTELSAQVIMIPGNHDFSGVGNKDALHVFDKFKNFTIVRSAGKTYINKNQNIAISCVPWSWNPADNPEETINALAADNNPEEYINILLAHLQVIGGKMNNGFCCERKPGKFQISRGFLDSIAPKYNRFVFGDFHGRQELVSGKGGYVGALRQLNFGASGNPAGFEIYDITTGIAEWIELDAAPKYQTIVMKTADFPIIDPAANIRVVYEDCEPDATDIKILEQNGAEVVKVIPKQERLIRAAVPEGIAQNPKELISLWASTQNPPLPEHRLNSLLSVFDEIHADEKQEVLA